MSTIAFKNVPHNSVFWKDNPLFLFRKEGEVLARFYPNGGLHRMSPDELVTLAKEVQK